MLNQRTTLEHSSAYREVRSKICKKLLEAWETDKRLPPVKELARQLGTGQSNTHRVIKDLAQKGILVSRPGLGTLLNSDDADLQTKLNEVIQVSQSQISPVPNAKWVQIFRDPRSEVGFLFISRILTPLLSKLTGIGLRITEHDNYDLEQNDKSDALILVNPSRDTQITCSPTQVITIVSTDRHHARAMQERFDFVSVDDIHGSILAGQLMKKYGWEDVGFLGVQSNPEDKTNLRYDDISEDRLRGFEVGWEKQIRPEHYFFCPSYVATYGGQAVSQWMKLNPRPQAIFAASDDLAYGFIIGAAVHGLKPGKDFQIIGFDGQKAGKDIVSETLTTIAVPTEQMGISAAKLLIERLSQPNLPPRRLLMGCTLIEGQTLVPNPSSVR